MPDQGQSRRETARSFAEARAAAERWAVPDSRTQRIQHIGSAWKGHEDFAVRLVEHLKPEIVVDLGVDYGFSTFAFALPNIGTVYGIDWFQGDKYAGHRTTYEQVLAERARLGMTNVVIVKSGFSDAARSWSKKIDLLHIDGNHDYESVKQDFEQWGKFVADDGVILLHDTLSFPDDVGRFYDGLNLPKFNFTHSYGLGVVCKSQELLDKVTRL
jgi:predicted O-methyltransferase YrrM